MPLPFAIVDVFAGAPLSGNPLAVVGRSWPGAGVVVAEGTLHV